MGGNTISGEVEVVDAPLNYNLLLDRNWIYARKAIISSVFHKVCFPFKDQTMMIDQMSFDNSSSSASLESTIRVIDNS